MPLRIRNRRRELAGLLVLAALVIAPTAALSILGISSLSRAQAVFEKEIREAYLKTADSMIAQGVSVLEESGRRTGDSVRALSTAPSAEARIALADALPNVEGVVILDSRWHRLWPPQALPRYTVPAPLELEKALGEALFAETRRGPEEAVGLYEVLPEDLGRNETAVRGRALSGLVRCYVALGRLDEARQALEELAAMPAAGGELSLPLFARYRLWRIDPSTETEKDLLDACMEDAFDAPAGQVRFYVDSLQDGIDASVRDAASEISAVLSMRAADERLAEAALYLAAPGDLAGGASTWGTSMFEGRRYLYVSTAASDSGDTKAAAVAFFDAESLAGALVEPLVASPSAGSAAQFRLVELAQDDSAGAKDDFPSDGGSRGKRFILERRFPEPFDFWVVRVYSTGGGVEDMARSRVRLMSWAFVLTGLAVVVAVGAVFAWAKRRADLARLQTDFVANVTHELKTPLTGIRSLAETIQLERLTSPEKEDEFLAAIVRESERLARLIGNVLDFSRLDRGTARLRLEETDLAALVRDCVADFGAGVNGDEELDVNLDVPDSAILVFADPDAMKSVLFNLLDNAYKYSRPPRVIDVSVGMTSGAAEVRVKDNGIGLTAAQAARVWRKFYRVDTSLSADTQGAGLGLSLVKAHVEAHGGTVVVESEPGRGSTFTVTLPPAREQSVE